MRSGCEVGAKWNVDANSKYNNFIFIGNSYKHNAIYSSNNDRHREEAPIDLR